MYVESPNINRIERGGGGVSHPNERKDRVGCKDVHPFLIDIQ